VFVTEIGFVVAFGVLLDTFVVRSVLVTALNLDAGRRIWWPSSLSRTEDVTLDQLAQKEPAAMTP
jgi:RND superfamily putative drug exporter